MQRPIAHQITATSSRPFGRWSWATLLVAALHIGVIYALFRGLDAVLVAVFPDPITIHVLTQPQPPAHLPLPPPSRIVTPQTDTLPPPIFKIEDPQIHDGITVKISSLPPLTPSTPTVLSEGARAVAGTHTIPDYPMLSRRLAEEGTVLLRIAIADDGRIADVIVTHSSGYSRLDEAAREWVMRYWRYRPATDGGKSIPSTAEASVVFNLKTAQQVP